MIVMFLGAFIASTSLAASPSVNPRLLTEELNSFVLCMRGKIAAAVDPNEQRDLWYRLYNKIAENVGYSRFINVEKPGAADISTPFAVLLRNVDSGARSSLPFGMDIDLLVFRGDPRTLKLSEIPAQTFAGTYFIEPSQGSTTPGAIAEAKALSLADLYSEFGNQKGVAEHIGEYTQQDLKPIATHFVFLVGGRPVARVQVQISSDHEIELNYEENFPEAAKPEPDGTPRSEVGRNGILRASKRSEEVQAAIREGGGDDHLRDLMFQKLFSWINSDVQLQKIRFQANGATRRRFQKLFSPFPFDNELKLKDDPNPAKVEWLLTFSRPTLLKLEETTLARRLLDDVRKISADPRNFERSRERNGIESHILLFFAANEISTLERIGLGNFRSPPPKGYAGTMGPFGFISVSKIHDSPIGELLLPRDKVEQLEQYLTQYLTTPKK